MVLPLNDKSEMCPQFTTEEEEVVDVSEQPTCTAAILEGVNTYSQFTIETDNRFRATTATIKKLIAGYYAMGEDNYGTFFKKLKINTTELIRFPNTITDDIINEFDKFWKLKPEYDKRGEQHKRGFLLHGPAGGGKSCAILFIMQEFIKQGGIVFEFGSMLIDGLQKFRSVEPDRKIMVIIEDIDGILKSPNEQVLLQFLDGGVQHTNTIVIATTNYIEKLPDRIRNRPSRFDRVEFIGYSGEEERKIYIKVKSENYKKGKLLTKMVKDTHGFTLAHIKELILAVEVYKLDYDETLERIRKMRKKKESSDDYALPDNDHEIGFKI